MTGLRRKKVAAHTARNQYGALYEASLAAATPTISFDRLLLFPFCTREELHDLAGIRLSWLLRAEMIRICPRRFWWFAHIIASIEPLFFFLVVGAREELSELRARLEYAEGPAVVELEEEVSRLQV